MRHSLHSAQSANLFTFVLFSPSVHRPSLPRLHSLKFPRRSIRSFRVHPICVGASSPASKTTPAQGEFGNSNPDSSPLSTQLQSELPKPTPFRLHPSDILVLALFLLSFLLPVLRSTRPPRAHAIFSATLFALGSALYVLRQRSIHRTFARQFTASVDSNGADADADTSENLYTQLIESRTIASEDAELTRSHIARSDRARDKQQKELLRAFRSDLDELQAGFSLVQDAITAKNTEEVSQLKEQLHQRIIDIGRLQAELEQARAGAENAAQREKVARTEADAFRTAAAGAAGLRERLIAAQTRTAALEERLDRAQNAVLAPQQQQQQQADQQLPGGRALRDALLNLGKSFPPAGRLLFDSVPESTRESDPRSQSQTSPPPPLSATRSWPDRLLEGQAPTPPDLGIPKDGGFGVNLFKKDQSEAADPFSAMRGAFNNESSTASLPQTADSQKTSDEIGTDTDAEETTDKVEVDSGTPLTTPCAESEEASAESVENPQASDDEERKFRVEDDSMEEERLENAAVEGAGSTEVSDASAVTSAMEEERVEDSSVEGTATTKVSSPSGGASASAGKSRADKARELVKRARTAPRNEAERLFVTAVELLEAAPGGGIPRDAELGSTLLAWARNDVGADGAKARLERAADLLRGASSAANADDTTKFNLGLTLCMLASLEDTDKCDQLYAEACEWYDQLKPSRTMAFNSGLAWIARARLAKGDYSNPPDPIEYYFVAQEMFRLALKYQPDDTKSMAYLAECDAKIDEAERS